MERTISAPVESLIPLVKSGMNWEKYGRRFPGGKLLTLGDELSRFVAERLAKQLLSVPSAISLRVVHASKERVYVDGIVQKGAEVDRVEGDVEWKRVRPLSKEERFRGYVKVNPEAERATKEKDYETVRGFLQVLPRARFEGQRILLRHHRRDTLNLPYQGHT